jgi:hypothetical protein
MPTEVLPIGMPWTMVANRVYALPPVKLAIFTTHGTPAFEVSNHFDFAQPGMTPTLTNGIATVVGGFIRTAASDVTVKLVKD